MKNSRLEGSLSIDRRNIFIVIDQDHEVLNKILKESGEVIPLTEDPIALLNWSSFAPEVNKRHEDCKISFGMKSMIKMTD